MVDDLAIREVMTREYVGVSESDTLRDAARLMLEEDASAVVVLRGRDAVGMVLERQVIAALLDGADPAETRIDSIMRRPPTTLEPDTGIAEAAAVLADAHTDHVFVGTGGEIEGVLSENDLITAVTSILTTEAGGDVTGRRDGTESVPERDEETSQMTAAHNVCESCGTLKADLEPVDGQLLCADCRDY